MNKNNNPNKKIKKKIANAIKQKQKKFEFYQNKNIKLDKHQNLITKISLYTFYLGKQQIKKKKKKFITVPTSFYKKIQNDLRKKLYIGSINKLHKFSKPMYKYDLNMTVFGPIKYIN
jgi:hypothetical protein